MSDSSFIKVKVPIDDVLLELTAEELFGELERRGQLDQGTEEELLSVKEALGQTEVRLEEVLKRSMDLEVTLSKEEKIYCATINRLKQEMSTLREERDSLLKNSLHVASTLSLVEELLNRCKDPCDEVNFFPSSDEDVPF